MHLLAAILAAAACGLAWGDAHSRPIRGSGSVLFKGLMADYLHGWELQVNSTIQITYNAVGDVKGLQDFITNASDFAISGIPLNFTQRRALEEQRGALDKPRGSLEIPFATTKVGVVHSIPSIPGNGALLLDANTLSAIYGCTITAWNDPWIAALNPNVTLPAMRITPLLVAGAARSTYALTLYTSTLGIDSTARPTTGDNYTWHDCVTFVPTEHAAVVYLQTNLSKLALAVMSDALAVNNSLSLVALRNQAGARVLPWDSSPECFSTVSLPPSVAVGRWFFSGLAGSVAPCAYPMTVLEFMIVRRNARNLGFPQGELLQNLSFHMLSTEFQKRTLPAHGFAGIPSQLLPLQTQGYLMQVSPSTTDTDPAGPAQAPDVPYIYRQMAPSGTPAGAVPAPAPATVAAAAPGLSTLAPTLSSSNPVNIISSAWWKSPHHASVIGMFAGIAVAFMLAAAGTYAFFRWHARRRRRRAAHKATDKAVWEDSGGALCALPFKEMGPGRDPSLPQGVPPQPSNALLQGSERPSLAPGSTYAPSQPSNALEMLALASHPEQSSRLRWLGSLEEEQLEFTALLGRGSFGRVYGGRWKGTLVAIKVVEHAPAVGDGMNAEQQHEVEALLACNLSHPNIIATYKICTMGAGEAQLLRSALRKRQEPKHPAFATEPSYEPAAPASGMPGGDACKQSNGTGNSPSRAGAGSRPGQEVTAEERAAQEEAAADEARSARLLETWCLMEYADKGPLADMLHLRRLMRPDGRFCDMFSALACLTDIASGLEYLHSAGIMHCDLKPANVLLKSTAANRRGYVCKLCDFGMSRVLDKQHATHVSTQTYGTIPYMPPELLEGEKLSPLVDVYSFGIIMWECFTGEAPFDKMLEWKIYSAVVTDGERPRLDIFDDALKRAEMSQAECEAVQLYMALMQRCWAADPSQRPRFCEVLAELGAIKRVLSRDLKTSGRSSSRPDSPAHPPVMRQLPTPFQVEAPAE